MELSGTTTVQTLMISKAAPFWQGNLRRDEGKEASLTQNYSSTAIPRGN